LKLIVSPDAPPGCKWVCENSIDQADKPFESQLHRERTPISNEEQPYKGLGQVPARLEKPREKQTELDLAVPELVECLRTREWPKLEKPLKQAPRQQRIKMIHDDSWNVGRYKHLAAPESSMVFRR
jgi:hypothetical protein